jgi:nicotinate (nicotinamide) nucleotide adenylyltransferase
MTHPTPLILIGGSFDPIHLAHLWMAQALFDRCLAAGITPEIRFLPTARSPFKQTQTSPKHRLAMLKGALRDTPFAIDKTEIFLAPPTYTLDTLGAVRARIGSTRPLIFVMGQDSLESLPRWKGGYALLSLASLWVFPRLEPNDTAPAVLTLPAELAQRQVADVTQLAKNPSGHLYLDPRTPPPISSSHTRAHLATTELYKKSLPERVIAYNKRTKLYGFTSPYES